MVVNTATGVVMLALLAVRSEHELWLIYVVMACYGAALALIDPAENALFVVMLPADERQRVNGLRMSIQEGGKLVAPLAGAGLFAVSGGGVVAAFTVTFVVAALAVARIRLDEPVPAPPTGAWRHQLTAGFGHVSHQPVLRAVTLAAALAMFASGVLVAAQFSLVDALGREPAFLGVLTGLLGAGSIVAGMTSTPVVRRYGEPVRAACGLANGCLGYLLAASGRLPAVVAGWVVLGFALPWVVVAVITLSQRLTPLDLQGRVTSAVVLVLFGTQPVAQLVGAALVADVGFAGLYLAAATLVALGAAWLLALPDPGRTAPPGHPTG